MKTKSFLLIVSLLFIYLQFFGQGILMQPNSYLTVKSNAYVNATGTAGLTIKSTSAGTGSIIDETGGISINGTTKVERYITNDLNWHFLSSPVTNAAVWPEFSPTPTGSPTLTFGASPWYWNFYYWNPNCLIALNSLPWVNLRRENGEFNTQPVEGEGNEAGFGTVNNPAQFEVGRGYLVSYGPTYTGSTTHNFTGTLNSGNKSVSVTLPKNPWNLVGNPYPSSIDWQAASGWTRSCLLPSGSGYDMWIFNASSANYGVINSTTGSSGTNSVTRNIAPMQGFFVNVVSSATTLGMTSSVQLHSTQTWLKEGHEADNLLRLKLTTSANTFSDEMIVAVNENYENGGSPKFWSSEPEAPELFSIKNGTNYSIDRIPAVTDNSMVAIGIKAGVNASYTLQVSGVDNFLVAKKMLLEDLKSGTTQDLKMNPSYTFSANPEDNQERFHLHFGNAYGIGDQNTHNVLTIYSSGNSVYVRLVSSSNPEGDVHICNLLGQKILQQKTTGETTKIGLNAPAGCYIVTVVSKNQTLSKKVFIH
jgi:hypothetical protein